MPGSAPAVKKAAAGYGGRITFCAPTLEQVASKGLSPRIRVLAGEPEGGG